MKVYQVSGNGSHVRPVELVSTRGGGWYEYRVLAPDPLVGTTFKSRAQFAHTTAVGAVVAEIRNTATSLVGSVEFATDPTWQKLAPDIINGARRRGEYHRQLVNLLLCLTGVSQ